MNKMEAVKKWVSEWNAIPTSLIEKAYYSNDYAEGITHLSWREEDEEQDLYYNDLPMWGTMWTLHELDADWIKDNIDQVRKCGIEVYESDELGVFIGINGAGYDFYEAHWLPLYEARGLRWHEGD